MDEKSTGEIAMVTVALILAVLLHVLLGVKIAHFSREVRNLWDTFGQANPQIASSRFILYPINSLCKLDGSKNVWIANQPFMDRNLYIVLHALFWEARIALNLFAICGLTALFCIIGFIWFLLDSAKKAFS